MDVAENLARDRATALLALITLMCSPTLVLRPTWQYTPGYSENLEIRSWV